jgi:hypothetical protein
MAFPRRFDMEVILMDEETIGGNHSERLVKCNITETSELTARRACMERAWACGSRVVRFRSINERSLP